MTTEASNGADADTADRGWRQRLDAFQRRHRWSAFAVGVIKKYGDDRGSNLAALLAYYGFLSLFPMLLVLVTVVGFALDGNPALQRDLLDSALADFPVIGEQLRHNIHAFSGNGVAFAVGLVFLLWGSLGIAQAAQNTMADVWYVPIHERPRFGERLLRSVLLLGALGLGVVATTVASGAVTGVANGMAATIGGAAAVLVVNATLFVAAFRILTPRDIPTRPLLPGALVGALLWTVLQLFGSYLVTRQLRHASELYGFFAIVLGLLAWIYLGAQITVYAAELNVVRARRLWPRALFPPPRTRADEEVVIETAQAVTRAPDQHVEVNFETPPPTPSASDRN
jgi:YihY family inner membrane protein